MQSSAATQPLKETPLEQNRIGEAQSFELTGSLHQRLLAIGINLLVIGELFIAMYFAAQDQDRLTPIFFKVFFSLLVPTLIVAFIGKWIIRARAAR